MNEKIRIPDNVRQNAKKAFKLRKEGYVGATHTGWVRAKQLSTKDFIPIKDLRTMRNWFARHIYTSYPGYKKWIESGKQFTHSHAVLSWLTWGGDAGLKWVNSKKIINLLNKTYDKDYDVIKQ